MNLELPGEAPVHTKHHPLFRVHPEMVDSVQAKSENAGLGPKDAVYGWILFKHTGSLAPAFFFLAFRYGLIALAAFGFKFPALFAAIDNCFGMRHWIHLRHIYRIPERIRS